MNTMQDTYRFFDHTADIAFEAYGDSLNQLFEHAALAVFETMVNLKTVSATKDYRIALSAPDEEQLLFDFLSELVFLKDAEYVVFNQFRVAITRKEEMSLTAVARGESIDPRKHELRVDVKAVTLHKFTLQKKGDAYKAFVILDI